ncbi:MAG: hypothetical protein JWO06_2940, partial [Bacteroidota bacterium]|nr:hypothetical protein [Bacteroidota bacterium]
KKDSTIKNTYEGPVQGVGNKTTWTSKNSGTGSMEVLQSVPSSYLQTKLALNDFPPFESHFILKEANGATEVTWVDSGSSGFPWKIFNLLADKMMGPDFEVGLANLKTQVESLPKWKLSEYKIEELEARPILSVLDSCPASEIGKKLGGLYSEIGKVMQKNKQDFNSPVMAFYHSFSPEKVVLEAAVPVSKEIKSEGRVTGKMMPKTKVLSVTFFGDYQLMSQAMPQIQEYMKKNHLESNGSEFDIYMNDPTTVKSKMDIQTKINLPIK